VVVPTVGPSSSLAELVQARLAASVMVVIERHPGVVLQDDGAAGVERVTTALADLFCDLELFTPVLDLRWADALRAAVSRVEAGLLSAVDLDSMPAVRAVLDDDPYRALLERVVEALHAPGFRADVDVSQAASTGASAIVSPWWRELQQAVAELPFESQSGDGLLALLFKVDHAKRAIALAVPAAGPSAGMLGARVAAFERALFEHCYLVFLSDRRPETSARRSTFVDLRCALSARRCRRAWERASQPELTAWLS
jgi:hypothetical protein